MKQVGKLDSADLIDDLSSKMWAVLCEEEQKNERFSESGVGSATHIARTIKLLIRAP